MININELMHDEDFVQDLQSSRYEEAFKAVVLDASLQDLELLAEGERTKVVKLVITELEHDYKDIFFYKGKEYKILNRRDFNDYGFYKYLATEYAGLKRHDSSAFEVS